MFIGLIAGGPNVPGMDVEPGTASDRETAGVALPPPLLFAGGLGVGFAAARVMPDPVQRVRFARFLGAASVVAGIALAARTILHIRMAGTKVSPYEPTTTLLTDGPFAYSRNPLYVGATSVYVGIAMFARSLPAFVALPVVLALLDRLVVAKEEVYLEKRFGAAYGSYRSTVPRWF